MTDSEFVDSFEDCTLPSTAFHHRDHVRLAWIYLRRHPPLPCFQVARDDRVRRDDPVSHT